MMAIACVGNSCGRSSFSPSERSPTRVIRKFPEDSVMARIGSVGCQDAEVNDIVVLGTEWIGCGLVWSMVRLHLSRKYLPELDRQYEELVSRESLLI